MVQVVRPIGWLACLALVGLVLGCSGQADPTPPARPAGAPGMQPAQGQFDTESGPHAAGKKVLVASNCFRCHTVNGVRGPVQGGPMGGRPGGPGGPPMGGPGRGGPPMAGGPGGRGGPPQMGRGPGGPGGRRAPDLGKVGGEPDHTVDWFMKYIRNPKSVKADARMPAFDEKKIKEKDLRALAEYLASLK